MTTSNSLKERKNNKQLCYVPLKYTLMGSFLLLIIPILIAISYSNYVNAKNDLEHAYTFLQKQTENNILNAIKLVNSGHKVLSKFLDKEMEDAFVVFTAAYIVANNNPDKMNLQALKKHLGGKMDLYLISPEGIVKYTTYAKDLGLDLKKWPDVYQRLNEALQKDEYVDGGLATEARTGKIRKFSYKSAPDHKYLLELGVSFDQLSDLVGELDLVQITRRLKGLNPSLTNIKIFSRHGHALGLLNYKPTQEILHIINEVYENQGVHLIEDESKQRQIQYIFVNLKDNSNNSSSDASKVIELTYTTRLIDDSLKRTAAFHLVLSVIAIVLSIIFTFFIAAWLTTPIIKIVHSVNIIAQGDLEHPIEVETNNELKLLKQSISIMVDSMLSNIKKIKQKNIELNELDKLKDDFLSNTSHELRTPLNGIMGIAESMIDGAAGKLPEKAIENLSMIVFSGKRLSNLVNDILDFSKLKHKNLDLQIKPISIKVLVDIVMILSKPLVGKKEITLINLIKDDPLVDADENRLQQIFHNLISNAIKFTEFGSVEVYAKIHEQVLEITVADTGVGIPSDKLHNVFLPFEQADSSISREYGGTGLGLSITKQLIELHGGQINIQSTKGIGTKIYFSLPLSQAAEAQYTQDMNQVLARVHETAHTLKTDTEEMPIEMERTLLVQESEEDNKLLVATDKIFSEDDLHILIVDDDPINLQVLENQLSLENYKTTRAANGDEALVAIRSGTSFVIVLLDIMMPKMSGFEVCRIIRETHPANQLPVIMLTAKNQVSNLVEGLNAGANDYLTKPFSKGELITRIKTHVQLARVNIAYSNFVPLEFLHLLEKESIIDVKLGDHVQKYMAILFVDIRSFTTLSESMTPKENFDFINAYLGRVSPVIRKYCGFIDKYIGDAVMALFPNSPDNAVQAAIEIHKQLHKFNKERVEGHLQPIKIGIGIHVGTLMLGTIGEEKRMEGTVISDAVNLASRLEGLTKMYGASILISGEVLMELEDPSQHYYRFLGKVRVKGKQEAVHVFEILDSEPEDILNKKIALETAFNQALDTYYQQQFKKAAKQFQKILAELPQDKAATFYFERCDHYLKQGISGNWEGVEALTEK